MEIHAAPGLDRARNSVKRPVCDRPTHPRRENLPVCRPGVTDHDTKRLISQNIGKFTVLAQILRSHSMGRRQFASQRGAP